MPKMTESPLLPLGGPENGLQTPTPPFCETCDNTGLCEEGCSCNQCEYDDSKHRHTYPCPDCFLGEVRTILEDCFTFDAARRWLDGTLAKPQPHCIGCGRFVEKNANICPSCYEDPWADAPGW